MIQIIANVPSFSPLCDKMHLELLDPLLSFHLRTILVVCEICQLLKSSLEFEKKGIIVSTTVESNSKLSTTTMKNSRFDEELSNGNVSYSLLENRCHCYSFLRYICIWKAFQKLLASQLHPLVSQVSYYLSIFRLYWYSPGVAVSLTKCTNNTVQN